MPVAAERVAAGAEIAGPLAQQRRVVQADRMAQRRTARLEQEHLLAVARGVDQDERHSIT